MSANPIAHAFQQYLAQNPQASNEQIALYIRKVVPGANTTPASVSSMKSRLKSGGAMPDDFLPKHSIDMDADSAIPEETLDEAKARIGVRYRALERMCVRIAAGGYPSLIISGPPGLGKSFTINKALEEQFPNGAEKNPDDYQVEQDGDEKHESGGEARYGKGELNYDVVSGTITAVGLYQALWYTRNGGILVLDDCDAVFRDEDSLNILKAVLDSKKVRTVSWRKEAKWLADYGIDDRFAFAGHVVFLTNVDFETVIQSGNKLAEHFKALIDRSMYLCLTLRTRRDFLIRIRQVAEGEEGMLVRDFGLTVEQSDEVLEFVADNQTRFYNLSLRLVGQIAIAMKADEDGWKEDIEATKMKTL